MLLGVFYFEASRSLDTDPQKASLALQGEYAPGTSGITEPDSSGRKVPRVVLSDAQPPFIQD
jgi:hypothetical protein